MILVTGATGYTGRFLVRSLVDSGHEVRCLVRPSSEVEQLRGLGVDLVVADLGGSLASYLQGITHVAHVAPIWLCKRVVEALTTEVEAAVFVSSLRRLSSVASASVEAVAAGERLVEEATCRVTVLRPSMIYGPGDDGNISRLVRHLRRHRWLPVFGSGQHLQQPVFVGDVIRAIVTALFRPGSGSSAYAVAGPEAVPFNELVDFVGAAVGTRPRRIHFPVVMGVVAGRCLGALGVRSAPSPEQIRRLQEDKVFDIEPARTDLGFDPISFAEGLRMVYGEGDGG